MSNHQQNITITTVHDWKQWMHPIVKLDVSDLNSRHGIKFQFETRNKKIKLPEVFHKNFTSLPPVVSRIP